ncbi:hypothetical protein P1J78_19385 [Psychromarinibacter sp. C21-152]|uniref:Uncharacterized protein n=1 Tax=Psychromarinibacter sediminicola TaxID=3033385 RepID=A0AAE3NVQ8_9RHOB|nr:hypothetical protein [Psychromarinibacter sediminicola]MDF0602911.1 hypothetical protein [Psychromarinibacter sediminicola]
MKKTTLLLTVLALAGCSGNGPGFLGGGNTTPDAETTLPPPETDAETDADADGETSVEDTAAAALDEVEANQPDPAAQPEPETTPAAPPAEETATVEEPETPAEETTAETTAPAPEPEAAGDGRLGTTVASIGAADEPGFWIKTPLVTEAASGRLFYPASGRTVQVQLIPSGGAAGSGSQVSLAALRLLDAPLDGLPELVVYRN